MAKAGNHLNDISKAIGAHAAKYRYGIVRDLVGHGIGTHLHEDPQIPTFPQKRRGIKLTSGNDPGRRAHDQPWSCGRGMAGRRVDSGNHGWFTFRPL